jgi:hypothetical protein
MRGASGIGRDDGGKQRQGGEGEQKLFQDRFLLKRRDQRGIGLDNS